MRVTPQSQAAFATGNLQRTNALLARFQEQLSTGRRLLRPSDGPADLAAVLRNRADNVRFDAQLSNIRDASFVLESSARSLLDVRDILTRATLVAQDANTAVNISANEAAVNEIYAQQIDRLIDQLLSTANSRLPDGRFVFGGADSRKAPFEVVAFDQNGRPQQVVYRGAEQGSSVLVGPQQTVETLINGSQVFQSRLRATTEYIRGLTGAAPGTGTDTATGQGTLQVRHTDTSYPASPVQPGASSVGGDTVLGALGANVLTVDGANGTVSLNGGAPRAFTSADTDLRVSGPQGEVVFVDMSAVPPGFSGDVDLVANGTLSTDGGATTVAIDFSPNQTVTNSLTGAVTRVNSSGIGRTGDETLVYRGTFDVFETLIALRNDLRNETFTASERAGFITRRMEEIERLGAVVLQAVGEQGVKAENLSNLERRIVDVQIEIERITSDLESADFAEAIVGLQSQENLFNIGLAVAARVNSLSLADFLR